MAGLGRGKVILLGEHAVVYGRPALVAGIDRGVTARAEPAAEPSLHLSPWDLTVLPDATSAEPLARAYAALLATFAPSAPTARVHAEVELPGGAGLGCSAAIAVGVAAALDELSGTERAPGDRAAQALAWERVFHGNPSGVDTTASALGGVLYYRKGNEPMRVRVRTPLRLVVAHSGESSSTKTMVDLVARQHAKATARVDKTFDAIGALVDNGRHAVEAGDLRALGQLMDLDQALLSSLMVSTARLEELCGLARDADALGAKLTGAGGGGCMIALVEPAREERVRNALAGAGADTFVAEVRA